MSLPLSASISKVRSASTDTARSSSTSTLRPTCIEGFAGARPRNPSTPAPLRDGHSENRGYARDHSEQDHQIALRVGTASFDEAHVVHEDELADLAPVAGAASERRNSAPRQVELLLVNRLAPRASHASPLDKQTIERNGVAAGHADSVGSLLDSCERGMDMADLCDMKVRTRVLDSKEYDAD